MIYFSLFCFLLSSYTPSSTYETEVKCCPDGECYDLGRPWKTLTRPVPDPRCVPQPIFFIHITSKTTNSPVIYTLDNYTKLGSDYDGSKPTAFIFHGWMQSANSTIVYNVVNAYLSARPDANVWFIDYSKVAMNIDYPQAVSDSRVVARYVKKLIDHLIEAKGTDKGIIHLIGVSLGAHLAAYVAKSIPGIGRLTGLDPAGPLFRHVTCEVRFCKGDALFTEALHTNGNRFWGMGTTEFQSGDVDFLVSGGCDQPGCLRERKLGEFLNFQGYSSPQNPLSIASCSHKRSLLYYVEALLSENCTFWGIKTSHFNIAICQLTLGHATKYLVHPDRCTNKTCVPFGLDEINNATEGTYIMRINPTPPYCVS